MSLEDLDIRDVWRDPLHRTALFVCLFYGGATLFGEAVLPAIFTPGEANAAIAAQAPPGVVNDGIRYVAFPCKIGWSTWWGYKFRIDTPKDAPERGGLACVDVAHGFRWVVKTPE